MTDRVAAALPVPSGSILVVGDIMCDHYVWGDVERISPEAPVQVLRWQREADRPGGAANAAMNLAGLGAKVRLVGLIGNDDPGRWLLRALKRAGIDTSGVVISKKRATTVKTRIIARGQHMLRIDRESRTTIDTADERRMVTAIKKGAAGLSGVVCSDYGKGVLTRAVLASALSARGGPFSLVDPKGRDFSKYRGADLLTPNEKELMEAAVDPGQSAAHGEDAIRRQAESLMGRHHFKALLVTRGANGMDLFESGPRHITLTHIAALQRHEVFDVTGAGDTVAAAVALAASAGVPLVDAARLANTAAGLVVGMVGTAVVEAETLTRALEGQASQSRSKVLSPSAVAMRVAEDRARGAAIVFTSGFFDELNADDLHQLQIARARGDVLIVGVQNGSGKAQANAELLASLRFVDYVVLLEGSTPSRTIRRLRPDVVIPPGRRAAAR